MLIQTSHPFLGCIYLSVCLNAFFYHHPHIHNPHPPPTKMLEFIHLSVCLSACLSVFPPVSLSFFSVCIRKQVRITRKCHNHNDDETQYTDSHTTARKHSKLISQFFWLFSSAKWLQNYMYKITTNFTTELEDNTITPHTMKATRNNELTTT